MRKTVSGKHAMDSGFPAGAGGRPRGAVCFTFDDYHGGNWLNALPLFRKYNAHVTFFIVGEITPEKAEVMKQLQAAGHTIGLHTLHHRCAPPFIREHGETRYIEEEIIPQLNACREYGLAVRSFAFPNNLHDEECDRMLAPFFDHLRAGRASTETALYYPLKTMPHKCCLKGTGIGAYYNSRLSDLKNGIARAGETDSVLVFFSHNIGPREKITPIDTPVEWLEELLAHAGALNIGMAGFDELDDLKLSIQESSCVSGGRADNR